MSSTKSSYLPFLIRVTALCRVEDKIGQETVIDENLEICENCCCSYNETNAILCKPRLGENEASYGGLDSS